MDDSLDARYLQILIDCIEVSRLHRPKFGQGGKKGLSLDEFQSLYQSDPFYNWLGLDHPLMYAAHKASSGITSVYRQIGTGCELLFRQLLQDHLGLTPDQARWSHTEVTPFGQTRELKLDGRIELNDVIDPHRHQIIQTWMLSAAQRLQVQPRMAQALRGVVMEVRQGYKSKDSKRQNADVDNAAAIFKHGYLPVLVVFSTQIDADVVQRYQRGDWLVLLGTVENNPYVSTYGFARDILGYDLMAFFRRNQDRLKTLTEAVLQSLLRADHDD